MVMNFCLGSKDEEPEDGYNKIPRALKWRLKFGKKDDSDPSITRLGNNRIIKRGCESTEWEALRAVDQQTSIPVPRVIALYQLPDGDMVEFEIPQGRTLDKVWPQLSHSQKRKSVEDLGRFIGMLRKMEAPKHIVVGSASFGAACDHRFGKGPIGPFYTLDSFHHYMRRGHPVEEFPEQEIKQCHARPKPYELKFTHADLCPRNILVDESGRIASILGWGSAGWYPEYWEYTQMHHATPKNMSDWLEAMCRVLPRYDEELIADDALRKRFSGSAYDSPMSVRAASPSPSELARERREIDDKNTENTSG